MRKKTTALSFIGLAFILVGCYHIPQTSGAPTDTGASQSAEEVTKTDESMDKTTGEVTRDENTVTYTDSGFSPKSITVTAGTKVTFKNASSKPVWVASAVHPTHQLLPAFDQKGTSKPGESYSFTFTQAGQWTYHNHRAPGKTGVVVVQ